MDLCAVETYKNIIYDIAKDRKLHSFVSVKEYENVLKDSRETLGVPEDYVHPIELDKIVRNTKRRIYNRISAQESRKRKKQKVENLQKENKRLRSEVEVLKKKIENLEKNWMGCCVLCIWKELGECTSS